MLLLAACTSGSAESLPTTSQAPSGATAEPTTGASPSAGAGEDGAAVPASAVGMHVEGVQAGRWPGFPVGSVRLWDNSTSWNYLEPSQGNYDWTTLDSAVATAEGNGAEDITLVLAGTPEWAASPVNDGDYPGPGSASPPRKNSWWADYVGVVAQRYAGRITAYQVWNEMNLRSFWNGTPEQLATLTELAYEQVKAVDPDAVVVGASAGMRTDAYGVLYPEYLAALADRDWPVDALAVHTYPAGPGTPADRAALLEQALSDIAAAGAPDDLPLWDTEVNYGLAGPLPEDEHRDVTGAKAAGWVVRTYLDSLRLGVGRTFWYIQTAQPYPLLGIQTVGGSDGAAGVQAVTDWVVGATWEGCEVADRVVTCTLTRDGATQYAVYAARGTAPATVPDGVVEACDALGECRAAEPGEPLTLNESPLLLRE